MNNYHPVKYAPSRITSNYLPFKELKAVFPEVDYRIKDESSCGFDHVTSIPVRMLNTKTPAQHLVNKIYDDKLSKIFPESIKKTFEITGRIVLKCFEASMHKDQSWGRTLFVSVVMKAAPKGHYLFVLPPNINEKEDVKATRLSLRAGDVFVLDPLSIHSVHSTSQKKCELILLQYELEFKTRQAAVEAMSRCKYLYTE